MQVKQLSLNWVHAVNKGDPEVGFKDLIIALAAAPNETLFSTELVISLT